MEGARIPAQGLEVPVGDRKSDQFRLSQSLCLIPGGLRLGCRLHQRGELQHLELDLNSHDWFQAACSVMGRARGSTEKGVERLNSSQFIRLKDQAPQPDSSRGADFTPPEKPQRSP